MEKMPYRPELDTVAVTTTSAVVTTNWQQGLPVLCGSQVVLRELRKSDAAALFAMLSSEEVARFISPPPSTIDGYERFIDWTVRQRLAGAYVCFAVTVAGDDTAIGLFQLRQLEADFSTAEWGFAIASEYWGSGAFKQSADLLLAFAFDVVGVHRLEARAAVRNGRGNGALRKIGAIQEGILRKSFFRNGEYLDQALWSIIGDDWRDQNLAWDGPVH